jgi:RNA polymerase sporulation-specific sigma factor
MNSSVKICGINTNALPKLSDRQMRELIVRLNGGDKRAREELTVANMRLVLAVIKRFKSKGKNPDDLFQAGCVGLIKAIDNFDQSFDVRFSTYAVPMIMGEVKRYLRDNNSMRVPRSIRDTAYQVLKTRSEIEKRDEEATISRIAKEMNVAEREVVYALDAISDTVSLFDPVYNKAGDTLMIVDQIGDEKNTDENWTEKVAIETALFSLGEREKKIIRLRYYEGKTQTEISKEVGISQAQVSRLEKTALERIKRDIRI